MQNPNVIGIIKEFSQYSLVFEERSVGSGVIYEVYEAHDRTTYIKVYIRGSKSIHNFTGREGYKSSDYFLFGDIEAGLYYFGKNEEICGKNIFTISDNDDEYKCTPSAEMAEKIKNTLKSLDDNK